ncbi:hypothetical protein AX13_06870 [Comamonas aquatica DA1877]|jgi:uncharacterized membrane protein YkoI|uniref:PepSY domain-containing protein n=1 Tax=Comamonas aquatica DA1877 TaxID=1457173 RepID=A0A014P5R2_9BURK|nr:PepSY domain-containing protein [Comamonas aquatica]EXU81515.1 hypothetical protein AX13_06870 [Comamonas aquatica DA1877]
MKYWHHLLSHRIALPLAAATLALGAHAKTPAQWQALTAPVKISLEQAVQNATQMTPGQVIEIELDDGDGAGVRYEAHILTPQQQSVEVWVDAVTGQARLHENDGAAKRKDVERSQAAKIDILQAIRAATAHTPGKAMKAELDNHWGTISYQVDVLQADHRLMEVKLDAADGKVLRAKRD